MARLNKGVINLYCCFYLENTKKRSSQLSRQLCCFMTRREVWMDNLCRRDGNSAHYSPHLKGCDLGFPVQFSDSTVISYSNTVFYDAPSSMRYWPHAATVWLVTSCQQFMPTQNVLPCHIFDIYISFTYVIVSFILNLQICKVIVMITLFSGCTKTDG